MSTAFWQAKVKALLHQLDPFVCFEQNQFPDPYQSWLQAASGDDDITPLADAIASASDRAILSGLTPALGDEPLQVSHLLDGAARSLGRESLEWRDQLLQGQSYEPVPDLTVAQLQELFWWLWRCLPVAAQQHWQDDEQDAHVLLLPQTIALPDVSIWSHRSVAAAMAGALRGFDSTSPQIPHLVTFSFSPVQELIKASRKLRDFWAGSWILHYLSAQVCWALAQKYGPDSLIYPSLYGQPLIDHWLGQQSQVNPDDHRVRDPWLDFQPWLTAPEADANYIRRRLLTAGFPNVITLILPGDAVAGAMALAKQVLLQKGWCDELSERAFAELEGRRWTRGLKANSKTWREWLLHQWQTYWTALPLSPSTDPTNLTQTANFTDWAAQLNQTFGSQGRDPDETLPFTQSAEVTLAEEIISAQAEPAAVNVGSWWSHSFDRLREAAGVAKLSRCWKIPTVFLPRSSISGLGPVLYPRPTEPHISEGETADYWQRDGGLFDGIEMLNATEVVKRTVHQFLPELLDPNADQQDFQAAYPDLSSGVAGWLKCCPQFRDEFVEVCQTIQSEYAWTHDPRDDHASSKRGNLLPAVLPWGIPWVDESSERDWPNPRLLNAGWLIDDYHIEIDDQLPQSEQQGLMAAEQKQKKQVEQDLRGDIGKYFRPGNNPTDWYVMGAGDGDSMGKWLNGEKLKPYGDYMPKSPDAESVTPALEAFQTNVRKRMGPSTHGAFSRALLDFSNQLVPHITEERYAGRLIYGGGDDVLAYTNLWEWDSWLWDIRECFRGEPDPNEGFKNTGRYWQVDDQYAETYPHLPERPLFTVGERASASFGVVVAHQSVPLAIALENLWAAEQGAKQYQCDDYAKDAVQVRVLFGNGNILKATSRFPVFDHWRKLLDADLHVEASIYEAAAQLWADHPVPDADSIVPWAHAFCQRREQLTEANQEAFRDSLATYLRALFESTPPQQQLTQVQNWLKLAAFMLRNRTIKPIQRGQSS